MNYQRVHIEAIGVELAPVVVTSTELEARILPVYEKLRIAPGQVEALTGIVERRWWHEGAKLREGAAAAGRKALAKAGVQPAEIGALIYAGVCRENYEPATACAVADALGLSGEAFVYDISNACLGVLNGIVEVANRIELGQIEAGMVVSCETAREINDVMIARMLAEPTIAMFAKSLATLTGGSGAVAVLLTSTARSAERRRRLQGAVALTEPKHHELCRWGLDAAGAPFMTTDSVAVMKHGVELGKQTWKAFLRTMDWTSQSVDKTICHQVGSGHRATILRELGIAEAKDFTTFRHLGNIGTVSLPLTAAMAEQRGHLQAGDKVAFLGIGSGLNCMMLGLEW